MAMFNAGDRVQVVTQDGERKLGRVMDTATNCAQVLIDGSREGVWIDWPDISAAPTK